jgi:hypothetical protein
MHLLITGSAGLIASKSLFEKPGWEHGTGKLSGAAGRDARATPSRRRPLPAGSGASVPPVASFRTRTHLIQQVIDQPVLPSWRTLDCLSYVSHLANLE